MRPDLKILPIRGNVQTRLAKLHEGEYDAIILAEAGIVRLEMHELSRTQLSRQVMLPAPGQGALGIEVRSADTVAADAVARLNHIPSRAAVIAERAMLAALHGGCLAPIAALAEVLDGNLYLSAVVLSNDGRKRIDKQAAVPFEEQTWHQCAMALAKLVTDQLIAEGAPELIQQQR